MDNNNTLNITSFKREITKSGNNFLALSPIPALNVHIGFFGKLAETEVLWDATVQTLASFLQENPTQKAKTKITEPRSKVKDTGKLQSFMQVKAPQDGVSKLTVVLPVPIIDEPTIKKTIIMIRCYKRLKVGYHEFGGNL